MSDNKLHKKLIENKLLVKKIKKTGGYWSIEGSIMTLYINNNCYAFSSLDAVNDFIDGYL